MQIQVLQHQMIRLGLHRVKPDAAGLAFFTAGHNPIGVFGFEGRCQPRPGAFEIESSDRLEAFAHRSDPQAKQCFEVGCLRALIVE